MFVFLIFGFDFSFFFLQKDALRGCAWDWVRVVWNCTFSSPEPPGGLSTRTRRLWGHRILGLPVISNDLKSTPRQNVDACARLSISGLFFSHTFQSDLACMTGALWAKRGERDISRGARHEREARDEGKRKIKRLFAVHCSCCSTTTQPCGRIHCSVVV